jgi:TP901 family phage tail tape measure protein/lambda family phage tail tape measure protein
VATFTNELKLDVGPMLDSLNKAVDKARVAGDKIGDGLAGAIKAGSEEAKLLGAAFDGASNKSKASVESLKKSIATLIVSGQGSGDVFDAMVADLKNADAEAKKLQSALKEVDALTIDPKIEIDAGATANDVKSKFGDIFAGGVLGGVVAQAGQFITQGLTDAIAAGSNFENALQSVSAVTGVTGTGLDDLGERAKNLALQFGGSATTQLEAFQTVLSKFGPDLAKTPEALGTVAESVNLLGKAAGLDAKASVDALSNSMLQFGVDASDPAKLAQESGRFINVLAASAKVGAAEIPQVADAILQAGVAAKGANLSFEETNAAIQQLAVGGKVGSEAGVGLRNVIGLLIKQGGPGEEALAKVGLSAQELGKTLTTQGLASALEQLRGGVDKLGSDAEKAAFKATLFGSENAAAAGILLDGVDNIKAFTEGVTGTEEALTQAAINSDTLAARFDKFKAAIEVGLINAFQALAPLVKAVFDNFDVIGPILAVAAAGVAAYALAANAAAISQGIASAATAAWNAVLAANPVGLVAVAVVAATAAIIALADAMTISAGEALENAQAEKKLVEQQIASNKERKVSVTQTKSLTDEYQRLASKSQLTAQEQKRLTEIQGKLDRQYPNLIDQTKSFGENLEGVQKIGKLTTDELGKLDKQAQELAGRLEKATRNIAFAARNAAISELTDLTDRTLGLFGNAELERAGQAFANNIFQAKNAEDAQRAFAKFSETVNKLGIDAKDLNEIYGAANTVLGKTIATFTKQGEAATATADDVKKAEQAKATATEEGSKKAAKAAKEVPTAFDLAQKELKKIAERQKRDVELLKTELGEIGATPAEIKTKVALLERGQIEEFRRLATSLLGIEFKDGVPVNSTLKLGKDESVKNVVDEFEGIDLELRKRGLALRVPIEPERKQSLIKLNKVLAGLGFGADFLGLQVPITPVVEPGRIEKALTGALTTTVDAVKGIDWKAVFGTPAKASEEAVAKITGSITEGVLSYQDGIDELQASLAEQPGFFETVLMQLNESFAAATQSSISSLSKLAENYSTVTGLTGEFYNALAQTTGLAFAQILTAQEDFGKQFLLTALDVLNALIPILVAQITGVNLASPANIAAPGSGLVLAAALTAVLYGLVGAAKAAVSGFAEGGYTGDGGKYTPAGVVHRGEFVINKENTRRYRGILEQMNDGNFPLALAGVPMQSNDGLMTEMSAMRQTLTNIQRRLDSMPNGIEGRTAVALDVGFDQYLYSRNMHRTAVRNLRG